MNELRPHGYQVELRRNEKSAWNEIDIRTKRSIGYQKVRTVTRECIWPVGGPVVSAAMGVALGNVLGYRG
jgi:hypothetical protein